MKILCDTCQNSGDCKIQAVFPQVIQCKGYLTGPDINVVTKRPNPNAAALPRNIFT